MASFLGTNMVVLLLLVCSSLISSVLAQGGECNIRCLVADPVCGTDGVTYGCGRVEAECNGVEVAKEGPCDGECDMECFVYDPVCGADGVTYGCGAVEAKCHKVEVVKTGPC